MSTAIADAPHADPAKPLIPPGPRGVGAVKQQIKFLNTSPVQTMRDIRAQWGTVAAVRLGNLYNYVICEPEYIHAVLMDRDNAYRKDAIVQDLDELLGQGLLTAEGDAWRRNRKLAAPALKRKQIEAYADWMVELTNRELDRWRDGAVVELHQAMMGLTLKIVVKTLFNIDLEEQIEQIGGYIDDAMDIFHKRTHTMWRLVPKSIPTPLQRRFAQTIASLDEFVYELIARRRDDMEEGDDLLYRLLIANDEDGGLTDKQLRDEVLTMFIAGHETTALALSYAWYLLSTNAEVSRKLYAEVDEVLGGRTPTAADTSKLPYLLAVVQETLRMYSPAWIIGREAMRDTTIGPYFVPKGTQVLLPQSVVHYEPQYFADPFEFRPERWLDPNFEKSLPKGVYFPFGGGQRVCIGQHFAMMELLLMVATMVQRCELENAMATDLRTQPAVTLRPTVPISMRVHHR